jgi:hypothetical protein
LKSTEDGSGKGAVVVNLKALAKEQSGLGFWAFNDNVKVSAMMVKGIFIIDV